MASGTPYDFVLPNGDPFVVENVFTDLKRHDLGPDFDERDWQDGDDPSTRITKHMTEPLWGVGSTAPYGHDGRSINLREVILRHGGQARRSRNAFASASPRKQRQVLDFLGTLVLFPPDDTASNLNPGDPSNPDIIWAGTQEAKGIYKSNDKGETWDKKDNGVIEGNEISSF